MNKSQIHDLAKRIFKISIAVTIIAYLFYLMHWPFQKGLSLIADLSLVISFITIYSFTSGKTIFHHIGLGASILILLNILYPYLGLGLNPLVNYKNIAILSLIGPEIFSMFSGKNPQKEKPNDTLEEYEFGKEDRLDAPFNPDSSKKLKPSSLILGIGALPVLLGLLFKIQHYPGASILLIFGFLISAIGVFLLFIKK